MLAKIKRYSESNPSKIMLATGDTNQLETIDLVSNQIDYEIYTDHCINTIFPNDVMLHENKRLRTQADKETLRRFKDDIFNEDIPTSRTIKKYFKFATEVKTVNNIAYKNSTCEGFAQGVRSIFKKAYEYVVGEVLVCRKYLKGKFGKCSVILSMSLKLLKMKASS